MGSPLFPARQDSDPLAEGPQVAKTGEPVQPPQHCCCRHGPELCNSPTPEGPCQLRLGHPVGPGLPGFDGHLP